MGLKEWIIPQDTVFFDLLDEIAAAQVSAADILQETISNQEKIFEHSLRIKELETYADTLVQRMFVHLLKSFITPIEHDDIGNLARMLDDIIDHIYGAISRMYTFEATPLPSDLSELVDVVHRSTISVQGSVKALRQMKKKEEIERHCNEVKRLENVADEVSQRMIARLYKEGDVLMILKQKEIIDMLEEATDCCEDVADIIANIVIKNA